MYHLKTRTLALLIIPALMLQIFSPILTTTYADNTAYYIDATLWSDLNDGLTPGAPWQTLSHASIQSYLPGDQILLKCGEQWGDTLSINSGGAPGNELIITGYDACTDSNRPQLNNPLGWKIQFGPSATNIIVTWLTLINWWGIYLSGSSEVRIAENTFINMSGPWIQSFDTEFVTIENNYFELINTGSIWLVSNQDALISVSNNTFSGWFVSIDFRDGEDLTLSNNTFYNPVTHALVVTETSAVPAGTVQFNNGYNNTFLTHNPAYPMVRIDDQNDDIGTLISLSWNRYINLYKNILPLVEILWNGAPTITYDKTNIGTYDPFVSLFNYFWYPNLAANQTRLLVNTGSSAINRACPSGIVCPQYVDTSNASITWPRNMPAYSSEIILWNNGPNIERPPHIVFNTSEGNIPNGESVELSWNVTNALTITMMDPLGDDTTIPSAWSGTYYPPLNDMVNTYTITAENNIWQTVQTVDIATQNNPPTPVTFFMTGSEDTTFSGALQASDSSGDLVYFELFTPTMIWVINYLDVITWEVEYTPPADFCGTDTFEWRAFDQFNSFSDPEVGTITVECINDVPVAIDDTLAATGGLTAILNVTANDIDVDEPYVSQTFTVSGITLPLHGPLVASGSIFEYTPDFAYFGTDEFTYVVIDQDGAVSNIATVTLNVIPGGNLPPEAFSGIYMLDEDASVFGTFSGTDINGDTLSFSAVTLPSHGSISIIGTDFTYTPDEHYHGIDSFDFVAYDGEFSSNIATMTLNINSIDDAPVAVDDTVNVEMNATTSIDVLINDYDPDEPYTPQFLTIDSIGTPSHGTASIVANRIEYTPDTLYLGPDTITYTIRDQDGYISNTATVYITVSTDNNPPIAEWASYTTDEDIPVIWTLSGSDIDGTPVTFSVLQNPLNGNVSISSTGYFIYTPDEDYSGIDSFTFTVSDGVFTSNIAIINITIDPVNDAPIAILDSVTTDEDTPLSFDPTLNDTDAEWDPISILSFTQPLNGTASASGNTITYMPDTDYCGSDTMEYIAQDDSGLQSNVGSISITINCINDAPIASWATYTMTGNALSSSGNTLSAVLYGYDVDGDSLSYTIVQNVSWWTLTITGASWVYEPNIGFSGTESFTYFISDGTLDSTIETILIEVVENGYNAPPTASWASYTIDEDNVLTGILLGTDPEWMPLSYNIIQNVGSGVLVVTSTWYFIYTPNTDYHGMDSFTFTVSDGVITSNTAIVNITINPVNDAPMAVNDSIIWVEDTPLSFDPTINDIDVDGDSISLYAHSQWIHGGVTASWNTLTYHPDADYCGADTVTYTVIDTVLALSNTGTISISLLCVNDAPIANDDVASMIEDTSLWIPVLANDTDAEGDVLSINNINQPGTGGTAQISGTWILFNPSPDYCTSNPIVFSYRARDAGGAISNTANITITEISCVNDAPRGSGATYTMTGNVVINSGTVLSGGVLTGYLATNNTLIRTVSGYDVDGDMISFSAATLPAHGDFTLSSTGFLQYSPDPGYFGTDIFTYIVSDGILSSAPISISIVIQNPTPPIVTGPIVGPGGGGGGGAPITYANYSYTSVAETPGTSTGLTSQLLLNTSTLWKTGSTIAMRGTATWISLQSMMLPIIEVVEAAKSDTKTSGERAVAIRQSWQKIMHTVARSMILSSIEKSETLKATEKDIEKLQQETTLTRESRALSYILRLMRKERVKIERTLNILKTIL